VIVNCNFKYWYDSHYLLLLWFVDLIKLCDSQADKIIQTAQFFINL